jgi:hypothetical protein
MTEKRPAVYSPKKHVRIDKMGGVVDECFHDEVGYLVDELNYTGSKFLEEGIKAVAARHALLTTTLRTVARVETVVSEGGT